MRKLILVLCIMFLSVGAAYATENGDPCEHKWKSKIYNECSPHTVDTDTIHHDHREDPRGVGVDLLVHETEHADIVAEYKHDFENKENSVYAVVRTKTSVVDLVKKLINKVKNSGE